MSQTSDLRNQIDQLESVEGDGTELVTLTVPSSKSIRSIRERIAQEHADAKNIKSDQTRDRVQQALNRIQRTLRQYEKIPENGLVVYAGVIDGDLVSYVFDDLPAPVTECTYRCDDHFEVTPLVDTVVSKDTFGLIVLERGGAAIGRLVGEQIIPMRTFQSQVMGKSQAGGWSQDRFEQERERQEHEFFQEVGEIANTFVGDDTVTGLAIGGTLATVKKFTTHDYLDHRLRDRLLGPYSVEYATIQGLQQLVDKAENQLLNAEQREGRELLDEFYSRLRDGKTVAYGEGEVEKAIEFGAVDTVLIASTVSRNRRQELETAVSQQGGDVYVVPSDTEHGRRFADNFGSIGALLRFPVN